MGFYTLKHIQIDSKKKKKSLTLLLTFFPVPFIVMLVCLLLVKKCAALEEAEWEDKGQDSGLECELMLQCK